MESTNKFTVILLAVTGVLVAIGFVIWLIIRPQPAQEPVQVPVQNAPPSNSGSQTQVQTPAVPSQPPAEETSVNLDEEYQRLFDRLGAQRLIFARVDSTQGDAGGVYALYEADVADARASFPELGSYPISVALTDLGGDSALEAVVIEDLPGYCGTAGCPVDIYRREGNAWTLVFSSLVGEIVGVSSTQTNGYAELYFAQGNAVYQYAWTDGTYVPWALTAQWDGTTFVVVQ
jgi:hypothetical protein